MRSGNIGIVKKLLTAATSVGQVNDLLNEKYAAIILLSICCF